jgi:UDP-glucose 4-epimerase
MNKVLVTGALGFIGPHLVRALLEEGHEVVGLDNNLHPKPENFVEGCTYIRTNTWDLFNYNDPLHVGKYQNTWIRNNTDIDTVFHLGEYSRIAPSFDEPDTVWLSNSLGTLRTLEFCHHQKCKIIYAGSSTKFALEGANHSPYAFSKAQSAQLVKNYGQWYGIPYSICYFYNVFGPGYDSSPVPGYESVISVFEKQWRAGKPLTVCGDGLQKRAFTYVQDIVRGMLLAWKYPDNSEFQLNNKHQHSILEVAQMFGGQIIHTPERPGDRRTSVAPDDLSRERLNWDTTMNVDQWIQQIKNEVPDST